MRTKSGFYKFCTMKSQSPGLSNDIYIYGALGLDTDACYRSLLYCRLNLSGFFADTQITLLELFESFDTILTLLHFCYTLNILYDCLILKSAATDRSSLTITTSLILIIKLYQTA